MNLPSLPDLKGQLEAIDTCLRKYVRMRAILIEVVAFMEDEQEQEHLRLIRERARMHPVVPEPEQEEASRPASGHFRPKAVSAGEDFMPRRPSPLAGTLSMEA